VSGRSDGTTQVDGALFSAGDCHAAQGDGEVCVSGIECPMTFSLRFNVQKGRSIRTPRFVTRGPLTSKYDASGYYAITGIASDLMDAAKTALREMIGHLVEAHQLSREDAYILASVAVDLKISEVVDRPNWIVSAYVPHSIFR
jgi:acetamidase/formamidase